MVNASSDTLIYRNPSKLKHLLFTSISYRDHSAETLDKFTIDTLVSDNHVSIARQIQLTLRRCRESIIRWTVVEKSLAIKDIRTSLDHSNIAKSTRCWNTIDLKHIHIWPTYLRSAIYMKLVPDTRYVNEESTCHVNELLPTTLIHRVSFAIKRKSRKFIYITANDKKQSNRFEQRNYKNWIKKKWIKILWLKKS